MGRSIRDLTGQRFGDLEVIEIAGKTPRNAITWRCKCHRCGSEAIIPGQQLTNKRSPQIDCGCRKREKLADLPSGQYGGIYVIGKTENRYSSGDTMYRCRCLSCGKEFELPKCTIKKNPQSCGCLRYPKSHFKKMSAAGTAVNIVNGANLGCVFKEEATKNSKTGVRGVFPESGRAGQYRFSCRVAGETIVRTGFRSIEAAKAARDEAQALLIQKHGISAMTPKSKNTQTPKNR